MTGPVLAGTVVGLALVVSPAWRLARGWVTLAHELGHAVTAVAAEARVRRIRIHLDTSGLTEWAGAGARRRLPRGIVAWWGHPFPGVLAVALAASAATGHAVVAAQVLVGAVALVAVIWIRSAWGVVVAVALVALAAGGAAGGATTALGVVAGVAVLWAAGGLRAAASAARGSRRGDGSDAAVLAEVLWMPVGFWAVTMVVVATAALGATALLLVEAARA